MTTPSRKKTGTADEIDKQVSQRLKTRRAISGLSQEKLAESIGLTFQQIQKYESGANRISASRLYQFAKIFKVPVDYFFTNIDESSLSKLNSVHGFSDNDQEGFEGQNVDTSRETMEVIKAYYAIKDTPVRKSLLALMRSLSGKQVF